MQQKTSKEEVQHWDTLLDEYESKNGVPVLDAPGEATELQEYLKYDIKTLEAFTAEHASALACRLSQFAFHIQKLQNRELARVNWSKETIKEVIANEVNNYKGYSYEERSSQAIKQNEKASALKKIQIYAQQRFDRLQYLARSIDNYSDHIKSIAINKGKRYGKD